jgi:phospholipid transport system transporter-binding protein
VKNFRIAPQGDNLFALSGELDFDNVPGVWKESLALFSTAPALILDLSGVTRTNSAGLALLIEWLRLARQQGKPIEIRNVPEQMRALISASGLDEVLPLSYR